MRSSKYTHTHLYDPWKEALHVLTFLPYRMDPGATAMEEEDTWMTIRTQSQLIGSLEETVKL